MDEGFPFCGVEQHYTGAWNVIFFRQASGSSCNREIDFKFLTTTSACFPLKLTESKCIGEAYLVILPVRTACIHPVSSFQTNAASTSNDWFVTAFSLSLMPYQLAGNRKTSAERTPLKHRCHSVPCCQALMTLSPSTFVRMSMKPPSQPDPLMLFYHKVDGESIDSQLVRDIEISWFCEVATRRF